MKLLLTLILALHPLHCAAEEIRIGALLPLTGALAESGKEIRQGMTLAVEELTAEPQTNNQPAPKIKLIFEDTAFDMRQTASATQKLLSQDKVDVVVSLWDEADVVAPITELAGALHIAIRWDPFVTKDRPLTFTLECTFQSWAKEMLTLLKELNTRTITLVGQDNSSTAQVFGEFTRTANNFGIKIHSQELFPASVQDYRSLLLKSANQKPDILLLFAYPPAIDNLVKQLKQVAPTQRFTGMLELVSDPSTIEGIPNVAPFTTTEEFKSRYAKRYNEGFKIRAPHGYELVRVVYSAYRNIWHNQKPTPLQVATELQTLHNTPSALGPLTVTNTRNIEHPPARFIVINGKREKLTAEMLEQLSQ